MDEIINLKSVSQFNEQRGQVTLHPLVGLLDQSKSRRIRVARYMSELYIVFLKDLKCGELRYGRSHYDYQDGTLVFIAPGQVMGMEEDVEFLQPNGWALAFHPDLILGTSLGKHIHEYSFFSYHSNEALHVSDRERQILLDCFKKIHFELDHAIDKHSKKLIVSTIELLLDYCVRFYDRQFITRDDGMKGTLVGFEELLKTYFNSDLPQSLGLPTVSYFAGELNLSPNYFGDLVKKETGKTAKEYIQEKVIDIAKERVLDMSKSISEVAYDIGFKYPQHFTRLFKQRVGQSPNDYRLLN